MAERVAVHRTGTGYGELVTLDSGVVAVTAAPGLGGRLLSVTLAGAEFLYRNPRLLDDDLQPRPGVRPGPHAGPMSEWLNWGGDKTWPAPQGWDGPEQWAGPPDPVLDSGPYTAQVEPTGEAAGAVTLVMTSGVDPRTGLRLARRVEVAPGRSAFTLSLTMTNGSDVARRWALWNVTQLAGSPPGDDPAGGVYLGLAHSGQPATVDLVTGTARPHVQPAGLGVLHVPHQDVVGKLGFPDSAGWLAHVGPDGTLTQRFDVVEGAAYPDGGSRAEVWLEHPLQSPLEHLGGLRPRDRVVECEVLGPLRSLAPGESTQLRVHFGLGQSAGAVGAVTPAGYWAGPRRLAMDARGGLPRYADGKLTGSFVPFAAGRLWARRAGGGEELDCGPLEPGRACHFALSTARLGQGGWKFVVSGPTGERQVVGQCAEG